MTDMNPFQLGDLFQDDPGSLLQVSQLVPLKPELAGAQTGGISGAYFPP